jgi:enamine deaminase RidA (YjgF/YER057c/UK114 family)
VPHIIHNPATVAKPASAYSHGIEVAPNARWLQISGQVGVTPDGRTAVGIEAQAEACWTNIKAILADAGMTIDDVTKVTTFLVNRDDVPAVRVVRDRHLGAARPASTLVVVQGLASPAWLIEVEAVAAKA